MVTQSIPRTPDTVRAGPLVRGRVQLPRPRPSCRTCRSRDFPDNPPLHARVPRRDGEGPVLVDAAGTTTSPGHALQPVPRCRHRRRRCYGVLVTPPQRQPRLVSAHQGGVGAGWRCRARRRDRRPHDEARDDNAGDVRRAPTSKTSYGGLPTTARPRRLTTAHARRSSAARYAPDGRARPIATSPKVSARRAGGRSTPSGPRPHTGPPVLPRADQRPAGRAITCCRRSHRTYRYRVRPRRRSLGRLPRLVAERRRPDNAKGCTPPPRFRACRARSRITRHHTITSRRSRRSATGPQFAVAGRRPLTWNRPWGSTRSSAPVSGQRDGPTCAT